jgi:hypothetical protein
VTVVTVAQSTIGVHIPASQPCHNLLSQPLRKLLPLVNSRPFASNARLAAVPT